MAEKNIHTSDLSFRVGWVVVVVGFYLLVLLKFGFYAWFYKEIAQREPNGHIILASNFTK